MQKEIIHEALKMIDHNSTKQEVINALKESHLAFQFATDELRDDPDVALAAIGTHFYDRAEERAVAFLSASERLKNDKDFIQTVFATNHFTSEYQYDKNKIFLFDMVEETFFNASSVLQKARTLYNQNKFDEALVDCNLLIDKGPLNLNILLLRARILCKQSKFNEAQGDYNKILNNGSKLDILGDINDVLKKEPTNTSYLLLRARLLFQQGKLETALSELDQVLDKESDNIIARIIRGEIYIRQNKLSDAMEDSSQILQQKSNHIGAQRLRANILRKQQKFDEALEFITLFLEKKPNDHEVRSWRLEIFLRLKRLDEAMSDLNHILDKEPNKMTIRFERAILFFNKKQYYDALSDLNRIIEKESKNFRALYLRARTHHQLNNIDAALNDYSSILNDYSHVWTNHRPLSEISIHLKKILAGDKRNSKALHLAGLILCKKEEFSQALVLLNSAIETDPNNINAIYWRAQTRNKLNHLEEALDDYTLLLEANPHNTKVRYARGYIYWQLRKYNASLADINQVLEQNPKYLKAKHLKAKIFCDQEELDKALPLLNEVLKENPDDLEILTLRAQLYSTLNELDAALTDLNKIHEKEPSQPRALLMHARVLCKQGKYDEALIDYEKIISASINSPNLNALQGVGYILQKKPHNTVAKRLYVMGLCQQKKYVEALPVLTQIINQNSEDVATLSWRANAYFMLNKLDESLADYTKLNALEPHSQAYKNVIDLIASKRKSLVRLSDLDETAAKKFHAIGLCQQKKYIEALPLLTQIINQQPDDATSLFWRAEANFMLNKLDESFADYTKLNELEPDITYYENSLNAIAQKRRQLANDSMSHQTDANTARSTIFQGELLENQPNKALIKNNNERTTSRSSSDKTQQATPLLSLPPPRPNITDKFIDALLSKKTFMIKRLIHKGVDVESKIEKYKQSLLHWCVDNDYLEGAKILLDKGANIKQANDVESFLLAECLYKNKMEMFELLLSYNPDIAV